MPLGFGGFQYFLDELCKRSLRIVGKSTQAAEECLVYAREALNGVIKSWEARGSFPWKVLVTVIYPNYQAVLGTDGNSYLCIRDHTSTSVDEPGVGANAEAFWIAGGSATEAWASGTSYLSSEYYYAPQNAGHILKIRCLNSADIFPVRILNAHAWGDGERFLGVPQEAKLLKLTNVGGIRISVDPIPQASSYLLEVTYIELLAQLDFDTDVPDFLEQFADALVFDLAANLAYEYGAPVDRIQMYERKAAIELQKMKPLKFDDDDEGTVDGSFRHRRRESLED